MKLFSNRELSQCPNCDSEIYFTDLVCDIESFHLSLREKRERQGTVFVCKAVKEKSK